MSQKQPVSLVRDRLFCPEINRGPSLHIRPGQRLKRRWAECSPMGLIRSFAGPNIKQLKTEKMSHERSFVPPSFQPWPMSNHTLQTTGGLSCSTARPGKCRVIRRLSSQTMSRGRNLFINTNYLIISFLKKVFFPAVQTIYGIYKHKKIGAFCKIKSFFLM